MSGFAPGFGDVAADSGRNDVKVLLGDGTGDMQDPSGFACGYYPWSVAAGDVNGDAFPDLVTANLWTNEIGVLLGDGGDDFSLAGTFATDIRSDSVVLGDFTGDGQVDAATVNSNVSHVTVLRGHGDGTLSNALITAVGSEMGGLAAGDFNRDGWLDAVTADVGGLVSVLINDQSWTPAPRAASSSTASRRRPPRARLAPSPSRPGWPTARRPRASPARSISRAAMRRPCCRATMPSRRPTRACIPSPPSSRREAHSRSR